MALGDNYEDEIFTGDLIYALENAIGVDVLTKDKNFSTLQSGQDTVATSGTPEQLNGGNSLSVPDGAKLEIRALNGNSGNAYVGDSSVTTGSGYELAPGQKTELRIDDVSSVYVDVATGGEGVSWIVE